ncbi:MAG: hypothetical protein OEZ22_04250 [Spirochaetia bacterium]|nr:hypothetical protein [Spirochaetia bacterium]
MNIKFFFQIVGFFLLILNNQCNKEKEIYIDTLLNNMIIKYGGEENLIKYDRHYSHWQVNSPIKGKAEEKRYVNLPQKIKIESGANQEIRIINDENVYKGILNKPAIKIEGISSEAVKFQLKRIYSPLHLNKFKKNIIKITDSAKHMILQYKYEVSSINYYVNKETFFIEKTESFIDTSQKTMRFITEYKDYKNINGVMVAHTENKFIDNMNTANNTLLEIQINQDFSPSMFEPFLNI